MQVALLGANPAARAALADALQQTLPGTCIASHCALQQLAESPAACATALPESQAAAHRRHFDLTLLLVPASTAPSAVDLRLRAWLLQSALPFSSVFGTAAAQQAGAQNALRHHARSLALKPARAGQWHWHCENCSDAACERRLFDLAP